MHMYMVAMYTYIYIHLHNICDRPVSYTYVIMSMYSLAYT